MISELLIENDYCSSRVAFVPRLSLGFCRQMASASIDQCRPVIGFIDYYKIIKRKIT